MRGCGGQLMGRFLGRLFAVAIALLLVRCTAVETNSIASKEDIPEAKYRKFVVYIENLDDNERPQAEQIVISALQTAGLRAVSAPDYFKDRGKLNEQQKAQLVQNDFDAVLYLKVVEKGVFEEIVPDVTHQGDVLVYSKQLIPGIFGASLATDIGTNLYDLKPDGSVYKQMFGLKTQVDLQDTKSAKNVWTSVTAASGEVHVTNISILFTQASNQIISKMREDHAI
jgi:hypothetical protein